MSETKRDWVSQLDLNTLSDALNAKHAHQCGDRSFSVKAVKDDRVVHVTVLLSNQDDSFHYPVEARVLFEKEELAASESVVFLVDYIDLYFEEYFGGEGEQLYLPIDWADHQYDAIDFQVRGQIRNKKLEAMADDLLSGYNQ